MHDHEYTLQYILPPPHVEVHVRFRRPPPMLKFQFFDAAAQNVRDRSSLRTALQADVYKTLEELVPLQVNVQAVASREVRERGSEPYV